jgi:CheY-like chemotaxis protein
VAWRGHGTVLLVDDEPIVREVAAVMLERLGFAVLAAADGAEAIERVRAEPQRFSAVLLDLAMPRMGGEECFTALHRLRPDLPVLLSSGYSQPELSQRFADRGLAGFIQKPYRYEDLATAMRAALGEPSRDPT